MQQEPEDTKKKVQGKLKDLRRKIQTGIEIGIRWLFFWESDDAKIGRLLRTFHQYFIISLLVFYFMVHILVPSYWYLLCTWLSFGILWISHIINGGCVFTRIEQKLTGEKVTIIDPLLELFQIPVTKETTLGITILSSTVCFVFITAELFARTMININQWLPNAPYPTFWPFSAFPLYKLQEQVN